jgi:hypothetical protein
MSKNSQLQDISGLKNGVQGGVSVIDNKITGSIGKMVENFVANVQSSLNFEKNVEVF